MSLSVRLLRLAHAEGLPAPSYETLGAAGLDLRAAVPEAAPLTLEPGGRALIPTGFCLALRNGVTCLNSPGTIDSDYRGEIMVILINHGAEPFEIRRGHRIAQMVIAPVAQATLIEVATLDATDRSQKGFGSTGI